ncbi:hypothetical protein G5O_0023 [Chlamydia psittaci 6BC]|nr:hypothetical protein G5O_0023 [Chlamydia psittaci 6BC]
MNKAEILLKKLTKAFLAEDRKLSRPKVFTEGCDDPFLPSTPAMDSASELRFAALACIPKVDKSAGAMFLDSSIGPTGLTIITKNL